MAVDPMQQELAYARERVGEILLERYRLERVVGCGGVAVVFQALDCVTGDIVAVKMLRQDIARVRTAGARFLREARIALNLQHPAVPRGITAGTDGRGWPLLVMEFVSGEDYRVILDRVGRLPVTEALLVASRVADALDVAHRQGVVHRDIKPENLMLLQGSAAPAGVCVMDFGLAHCLDEPRLSSAGALYGSPEFMSPEQSRGDLVSPASDLYSLGATLVDLLTGSPPFSGDMYSILWAHAQAPVPSLRERAPEIPDAVEGYVHQLLAKDPSLRPPSAREVRDVLQELARWTAAGARRPARSADGAEVAARATRAEANELAEELREQSARLQRMINATATAQAKLVEQLVAVTARCLERSELEHERRKRLAAGHVRAAAEFERELALLGDAAEDQRREAAIEEDIARLHHHAQVEQEVLLAHMRALQARLRTAGGAD